MSSWDVNPKPRHRRSADSLILEVVALRSHEINASPISTAGNQDAGWSHAEVSEQKPHAQRAQDFRADGLRECVGLGSGGQSSPVDRMPERIAHDADGQQQGYGPEAGHKGTDKIPRCHPPERDQHQETLVWRRCILQPCPPIPLTAMMPISAGPYPMLNRGGDNPSSRPPSH